MTTTDRIKAVRESFEASFSEKSFYEKQTTDDSHLELLLKMISPKADNTVLDLGTGTGYIAFPLAKRYGNSKIIGLDIVQETLKRNSRKAEDENTDNLSFVSYDGYAIPFEENSVDKFMQMKPDGHVRFYYLDEYKEMLGRMGFRFIANKTTTIRFPRRGASQYAELIAETNQEILSGYCIEVDRDEIWITENVLNMIFVVQNSIK